MLSQALLLVGLSAVLAAPVAKSDAKLADELSPAPRVSAEKILAFLVQHGLSAPPNTTPELLRGIRKHKDWIYELIGGGANVSIDAQGEVQAWQTGPPVYVVEKEDGTTEQMVADVELPVLPPKPWAKVPPSPLPLL